MSGLLDPKALPPETLYRLQSETWAQGAEYEQTRILGLIDRYKGKPDFTLDNLKSLIKKGEHND